MSEIENYKILLREIKSSLPANWPPNVQKQIRYTDENAKYFPAIKWGLDNEIINGKVTKYGVYGGYPDVIFFSYPFTMKGEEFLKTDNEKQLKLATDEAVKSVGSQIGKWGIIGIALIVIIILFIISHLF